MREKKESQKMDDIAYQKLLATRICDLDLDVNESMALYFRRRSKSVV